MKVSNVVGNAGDDDIDKNSGDDDGTTTNHSNVVEVLKIAGGDAIHKSSVNDDDIWDNCNGEEDAVEDVVEDYCIRQKLAEIMVQYQIFVYIYNDFYPQDDDGGTHTNNTGRKNSSSSNTNTNTVYKVSECMNNIFNKNLFTTKDLVNLNTKTLLEKSKYDTKFKFETPLTNPQVDVMSFSYLYNMKEHPSMYSFDDSELLSVYDVNNVIYLYEVWYPILQERFNIHDYNHHSSCFKTAGLGCHFNLPKHINPTNCITYNYNNSFCWYTV